MDNPFSLFHKARLFVLELFFPSFCLGCKKEGVFVCQDCLFSLDINEYVYCLCNKHPQRLALSIPGKCPKCQHHKLAGLYFALPYQEKPLTRKLIHQFKYPPYTKGLAKDLAIIIYQHLTLVKATDIQFWKDAILMPIPMEIRKQKRRGYNQAEALAQELSCLLKISLINHNLIKEKKTQSQIELSAKERAKNLKGAFTIKNPALVQGKKIVLVDDVYTTGSTMEECAQTLLLFGADKIFGISIAREG